MQSIFTEFRYSEAQSIKKNLLSGKQQFPQTLLFKLVLSKYSCQDLKIFVILTPFRS